MALADRVQKFRALALQALRDLFDQSQPFGRLALVQVLMLAGDTLVTISLAGTLFFSISPHAAKDKVLLYLVLTLAPFAVVSPLLGPLIDQSRGARRAMVVVSAVGRAVLCVFMARDVHSLLLFPEAFLVLVLSKLYLVTRGALVPEMAAAGQLGKTAPGAAAAGSADPPAGASTKAAGGGAELPPDRGGGPPAAPRVEFAPLNARLTLLGTLAGFVISIPGIILLKLTGAPGVLIFCSLVFVAGALAGVRLPVPRAAPLGSPTSAREIPPASPRTGPTRRVTTETARREAGERWERERDLARLQPVAHPEVLFGLTTMSLIRGLAGFLVFLLAFGLRREDAALWWYGFALGASGIGALVGLVLVPRLRERLREQQILLLAIWLIAVWAALAAVWGTLVAEAFLAFMVGVAGSMAQPSFDAMAQRYVPPEAQGRAFARFATRQQLVWVVGALIPVVVAFPFPDGDIVMAAVAGAGGLFYVTSRRALRVRAFPRHSGQEPG